MTSECNNYLCILKVFIEEEQVRMTAVAKVYVLKEALKVLRER